MSDHSPSTHGLAIARGRPVWVKSNTFQSFDGREVIRRARSRVGEDCYRLLGNNCEHFCEWSLYGEELPGGSVAGGRAPAPAARCR